MLRLNLENVLSYNVYYHDTKTHHNKDLGNLCVLIV